MDPGLACFKNASHTVVSNAKFTRNCSTRHCRARLDAMTPETSSSNMRELAKSVCTGRGGLTDAVRLLQSGSLALTRLRIGGFRAVASKLVRLRRILAGSCGPDVHWLSRLLLLAVPTPCPMSWFQSSTLTRAQWSSILCETASMLAHAHTHKHIHTHT